MYFRDLIIWMHVTLIKHSTCEWSYRNAEKDEEQFEMCLRSLEEEIMFNAGHLLAVEEPPSEVVDQPSKPCLKKKPGRGFRHALSNLYIFDSGSYGYKTNKKKGSSEDHESLSKVSCKSSKHQKARKCIL